jgi:hypothetical protein
VIKSLRSKATFPGESKSLSPHHSGTPVSPNDPYRIGLSAWIIQDGNYGDFRAGKDVSFAVNFLTTTLVPLEPHTPKVHSVKHLTDDQYRVVGEIVHEQREWRVIDFGIHAYEITPEYAGPAAEPWVRGEIQLVVDHFSYFERLSKEKDAPPLMYRWHLEQIHILTAPLLESAPGVLRRDKSKWGWAPVRQTRAWKDDGGFAEYLLDCRLLEREPVNSPLG